MRLKVRFGRLLFVLVVLAIVAYLVNGYLERIALEKADRERRESIERSVRASVSKMVSQYDALSDWQEKLSQTKSLKTDKILSIDLERLWLIDRPILFVGSIQDISTMDGQFYRVRMKSHRPGDPGRLSLDQLGLELKCSQTMLDSFMEAYPNLLAGPAFPNGVAVIAKIAEIKTRAVSGEESKEELRIGVGDCLDMTYTGHVSF
jgi:hypothetical protein